jgi:hypothetical protein
MTPSQADIIRDTILCIGYTRGLYDGMVGINALSATPLIQWPKQLGIEQVAMITFNYVRQHPEQANDPTGVVMLRALEEAYPVPKAK